MLHILQQNVNKINIFTIKGVTMKYKKTKLALVVTSGLMLSGIASAEGAATAPMLANTCAGCHGTNGSSVGPATPNIAGMNEELFVEMMQGYAKDENPSTIMGRIARGYTEEEIKAMAGFFSSQKLKRHPQQVDEAKAQAGEKLHKKYCEKCHEDQGYDNEVGVLAGQWMPYLQFSMADYQSGTREMPKKMKSKVEKMVEDKGEGSIEEVIHFYGSLGDK